MPNTGVVVDFDKIINVEKLEVEIIKAIAERLGFVFDKLSTQLTNKARRVIIQSIKDSPEYQALTDRSQFSFRSEIGLAKPEEVFDELFTIWKNSIFVIVNRVRRRGKYLVGSIKLNNIDTSFADVLSSSAAHYYSYSKANGTTEIPWLEWMLKQGDKIVVREYEINWAYPEKSRTGGAIMVPIETVGTKGWRVPPEYSGTITNNFVTRAIDNVIPALEAEFRTFINNIR